MVGGGFERKPTDSIHRSRQRARSQLDDPIAPPARLSCSGFLHPRVSSPSLTVWILALFLKRDEQKLLITYRLTFRKRKSCYLRLDGIVKGICSAVPPSHTTRRAIPSHQYTVKNRHVEERSGYLQPCTDIHCCVGMCYSSVLLALPFCARALWSASD